MKFKRDNLLLQKSIYAFLTAAAIFVFAMLFLAPAKLFAWLGILIDILLPFIWAFVLAYVGSRPMSTSYIFHLNVFPVYIAHSANRDEHHLARRITLRQLRFSNGTDYHLEQRKGIGYLRLDRPALDLEGRGFEAGRSSHQYRA